MTNVMTTLSFRRLLVSNGTFGLGIVEQGVSQFIPFNNTSLTAATTSTPHSFQSSSLA